MNCDNPSQKFVSLFAFPVFHEVECRPSAVTSFEMYALAESKKCSDF